MGLFSLSAAWVSFGSLCLSVIGPLYQVVKCVGIELSVVFLGQPLNAYGISIKVFHS